MKKRIISIDINYGEINFYIDKIKDLVKKKQPSYVCFSNVHMAIVAYDDEYFCNVVNSANFAFPDGLPIAKSLNVLYNIKQKRIAGMDFLPMFLETCNNLKYKVAFVGSTKEVLNLVEQRIETNYKGIDITNLISPPFNENWNNEDYINKINSSKTDVVFVALGCPKQENWMFENYKYINSTLFGIGGALPTFVGKVKRAPNWMQKFGLEWLYRLIQEPKRMAKRYFYTNSKFLFLFTKAWLRINKKSIE